VYEFVKDYTCTSGQCVSHTSNNTYESCGSNEKCINGKDSCQSSDYCVTDSDCDTKSEYYCNGSVIWKRTTQYECSGHACEEKDDPKEQVYHRCGNNYYCDQGVIDDNDGEYTTDACIQGTTTTFMVDTTTSYTTTTAQRATTTTSRQASEPTTTLRPTTTSFVIPTATTETTTSTTTSTSTTTTQQAPSLLERIIFKSPLELAIDVVKKIIDAIISFD
jgi:hypothetical protein